MTNLIAKLRSDSVRAGNQDLCRRAANEIERLRAALLKYACRCGPTDPDPRAHREDCAYRCVVEGSSVETAENAAPGATPASEDSSSTESSRPRELRLPIPLTEIIRCLEAEAGNTDTSPQWQAATALRQIPQWESRALMCRIDQRPSSTHRAAETAIAQSPQYEQVAEGRCGELRWSIQWDDERCSGNYPLYRRLVGSPAVAVETSQWDAMNGAPPQP